MSDDYASEGSYNTDSVHPEYSESHSSHGPAGSHGYSSGDEDSNCSGTEEQVKQDSTLNTDTKKSQLGTRPNEEKEKEESSTSSVDEKKTRAKGTADKKGLDEDTYSDSDDDLDLSDSDDIEIEDSDSEIYEKPNNEFRFNAVNLNDRAFEDTNDEPENLHPTAVRNEISQEMDQMKVTPTSKTCILI